VRLRLQFLPLALLAAVLRPAGAADIDAERFLENIRVLASDRMKGREDGRPELDEAAKYIAEQFRAFGLQPAGAGGYLRAFPITVDASLGEANRLDYWEGAKRVSLTLDEDFRPASFSASGSVAGAVAFAGYGITAPEYGYDDYAGLNVKDKVVLVLRHEPQEFDQNSVFSGKVYTIHAQIESKALNAKLHGARAVIFVNDQPAHPSETDELAEFSRKPGPPCPGIPFVQVKASVADHWLRLAGHSMEEVMGAVDRSLRPRSFALPGSLRVELSADVRQQSRLVQNVVAYLPGRTAEYLIVGAHYDHVGLGEQFSMAPSRKGTVHPGADDNASGTSGVIELARWFAKQPEQRRGILFLAFAGEEIGLVGSSHYVDDPVLPLNKAIAMINMDMIGRLRDEEVHVGGVATGSNFRKIIEETNRQTRLKIDSADKGGYGSSDQFSFLPREIPVLFFFTGLHADYHTPNDTWDRIDAAAGARLVGFIGSVAARLLAETGRPRFVKHSR
jgi:aminopeptidase YwaD